MLTGRPPFYSKNKHEILKNITNKPVPLPKELSVEAKSLLKGLFQINPKERLGFKGGAEAIKKHAFFSNMRFDELLRKEVKPPMTFKGS
jgi:serine/threonine protein kinase